MKESQAQPLDIDGLAARIRANMEEQRGNALVDMQETMPHLRAFLLGGRQADGQAPSGSVMISQGLAGTSCTLRIPLLGVEVQYAFVSWFGAFETIELDLAEGTTRWSPDYKQRRKEAGKYAGLVG